VGRRINRREKSHASRALFRASSARVSASAAFFSATCNSPLAAVNCRRSESSSGAGPLHHGTPPLRTLNVDLSEPPDQLRAPELVEAAARKYGQALVSRRMFWPLFLRFILVFTLLCGILLLPRFLVRRAVKVAAALILFPVSFFLLLDALLVDGIGFRAVILVPVLSLAMQGMFVQAISRLFATRLDLPTGNHATLSGCHRKRKLMIRCMDPSITRRRSRARPNGLLERTRDAEQSVLPFRDRRPQPKILRVRHGLPRGVRKPEFQGGLVVALGPAE
jgi:hypothetical protein